VRLALSTSDAHERSACATLTAHARLANTLSPRLQFSSSCSDLKAIAHAITALSGTTLAGTTLAGITLAGTTLADTTLAGTTLASTTRSAIPLWRAGGTVEDGERERMARQRGVAFRSLSGRSHGALFMQRSRWGVHARVIPV
jgi:hypothetical protein